MPALSARVEVNGTQSGLLYLTTDNHVLYGTDEFPVKRDDTGALVTDATVTFALKTLAGVSVTTGTCAYVVGSKAKYLGTIASTVSLSENTEYGLEITAVSGTLDDFRSIRCLARYRGAR